jgi:hypothetical protein
MANGININPRRHIAGTGQNLTIGAASVASTAVGSQTYAIRVTATGNCHISIGQAPTATATNALIKATDVPEIIACSPGDKVAVIQDAASTGTLNIIEMTH